MFSYCLVLCALLATPTFTKNIPSIPVVDPSVTIGKRATTTVIPTSCFDSTSSFQSYFNYAYPWGNTHNGAAIMVNSNAVISPAGTLRLKADYTGTQSNANIRYNSGTVYAKQTFTVKKGGGYDFSATFVAPTAKGTWPAFWLTSTGTWPPEIDIAEWKGTGKISFNTFNTSSEVRALDVNYPNPTQKHTVRAELRDANGADVSIKFFLDGKEVTTQYGRGYVGKGLWLIIDLQMEGSSGSPGPTTCEFPS